MKKITLWLFLLIFPYLGFAQLSNEGFEGATFPPTVPANWAVLDNGVGTAVSWAETTNLAQVNSGAKAAIMDRENVGAGNTSQDWLITPQINVPANGQLRFFTRQTLVGNNGSTYEIRVSTNASQTNQAAFTTIQSWTETTLNTTFNVYEEKAVSLPYPAGTQVYIAFVKINTQPTASTSGDRWLIDDVKVIQQCLDPTLLTVGAITPTSASLSWTNNGSATAWEVEVVPAASSPTGVGVAAPTNPFIYTGLTPGTAYKYYVRANCGSGNFSQWVGPFNFVTTPAGSICSSPITIGSLPYSQSSNTNIYGDEVDTPQGAGCAGGATNYMQGAEVFYSYTATFTGNITVSMTPTGVSSSLFVYNGCANVGVSCLGGVADATANPRVIPTLAVTNGQTYIFVISSSTTPAAGIPYNLVIQQVNCTPPAGLTAANIGTTTADLSWTNPSGATSWEVAIQPAGSPIPSGPGVTTTTNAPYAATGLTAATAYQYWVRADCGGGLFSAWAGPYMFSTGICNAIDKCNYTFRMTDSFGDGWNGAIMEVRQNGVLVATLTGPTAAQGTTPVNVVVGLCQNFPFQLSWTVAGTFPTEVGISVINNFAQTLYTKPAGTGSAPSVLYTASFDCTTPACLPPTALTATTITTTGATLGWNATATGATSWDIYVVPTGSPAPTAATVPTYPGVTTNPFVVTGLLPFTAYQFYVRSVCSATSSSIWAGPVAFTTLPTCAIPTTLTATGITQSSAVLNWTQPVNPGGSLASSWQVIILPCGSPIPTAATPGWVTVNTKPYTVLGLSPLTCYDYYVRATCSPTDSSPISGVKSFNTPDINDECFNAKLLPVNQNTNCSQTVYGSVAGATASPQTNTCGATADDDDVWFYFTATATTHYISLLEPVLPQTSTPVNFPTTIPGGLNFSVYRGTNCSALTQISCRTSNNSIETGLIPGETYYVRVYSPGTTASTKVFEICIGTKVISCSNAFPLCAINPIIIRNDVGVPANPNPINGTATTTVGCLGSAPSPTYYFLTIPTSGDYRFLLEQSTTANFSAIDLDVDFVSWGPFTSVGAACSSITVNNTRPHSNTPLTTSNGCDFSANPTETFSIFGAVAGEVYIVMITNYTANSSPPGKRGYIRITQQAGPIPTICCPYTNFTYSSSFYCKDGTNPLPVLVSGATAGTYSCPNPALVLNPTTGEINLAASAIGTYVITSTITGGGTCPTNTSTWSITISNPPSATIAYSAPSYCINDTTLQNVTITGSTGGFFSINPTGLSINPTTGTFTPSTSIPGIYTVTYTKPAAAGCSQYVTTTTVEIKALPIATFTYGSAPYCQNAGTATPTYTGGGTAGVFTSTPGLSLDPSTGVVDLGLSTPGNYTVTNSIAAAGGCASVTSTANITISTLPIGTFNYPNPAYCQVTGTVTPIFTGGGMAGTFSSTPGLVINPTTGEVDLGTSTTGVYTVTNTIPAANGCPLVVETSQITINPMPVATLASSDADNTICSNDTATISVVPTNFVITDATYVWTLNGAVITSTVLGQVTVTTSGTYEVTISLNGCTTVLSEVFTVNTLPNFTLSGTNLVKCGGEHAVISVVPVNFSLTDPTFTYTWTHDGNPMPNTTSSIDVTDFGIYEVTVSNQGCSSTHNVTVIPDNTDIPIGTVGECFGTNYIITASPISGSYDPTSVTYQWYNNTDLTTVIGTQSTLNVTEYASNNNISATSYPLHFTVKITTVPEGCIGDEIFDVTSSVCTIQKGISPNNDGANDFFDLRGLGVKQLNIYNRYGTKVYGLANYRDEWKGQSNKGQELPDGTYYYVIDQTSGETKSGWIFINR